MPTIPVLIPDPDTGEVPDEEDAIKLPAHWCICDRCRGEGTSSAHLGAFTHEEMYDDPDFAQDYMDGVYDIQCEKCHGSGKVLEIDRDACASNEHQRALVYLDEEAQYKRDAFMERKSESLMLGESTLRDWDGYYEGDR